MPLSPTRRWLLAHSAAFAAAAQAPPQPPPPDQAGQTIKVDVDLVTLFFSVRDRRGNYVSTLNQEDFEVFEDGKRQQLKVFTRETDQAITVGLLVDVSRSQESLIEQERSASYRFFSQVLRKQDLAFIISFGADTELLQDLTNSLPLLRQGLGQLRLNAGTGGGPTPSPVPLPTGARGTVLYEAVWLASQDVLRKEVGRKALVVITDGVDVGSRVKIDQAIEAAHRSDVIIYAVMFEDPRYTSWQYGGYSGEGPLRRMAEETGGRVFRVERRNSLEDIYTTIQQELRTQYAAAYTPSNSARDGAFRRLEIKPRNRDYKVQVRKGYYAPKDSA